jgi:hypothetical protein
LRMTPRGRPSSAPESLMLARNAQRTIPSVI